MRSWSYYYCGAALDSKTNAALFEQALVCIYQKKLTNVLRQFVNVDHNLTQILFLQNLFLPLFHSH